jgi:hypothetical protein
LAEKCRVYPDTHIKTPARQIQMIEHAFLKLLDKMLDTCRTRQLSSALTRYIERQAPPTHASFLTDKGRAMTDTTAAKAAYTIDEFCALYHIDRKHYYALQASGEGPFELRVGRRMVLTTRRSAEAWEGRFEKRAANDDANQATG